MTKSKNRLTMPNVDKDIEQQNSHIQLKAVQIGIPHFGELFESVY